MFVFEVPSEPDKLLKKEVNAPPQKSGEPTATNHGEDVVTAVAFLDNPDTMSESGQWDSLVTGRLNGTIYCGSEPLGKPEDYSDRSPVVLIRVAPGSGRVVALRESNTMMGGDCKSKKVVKIPSRFDVRPSSIIHRDIGSDKTRLSYVEAGSFRCIEFGKEMDIDNATTRNCGIASLPMVQAVPIPRDDSFLVIEDRQTPAVFTLKAGSDAGVDNDRSSAASEKEFTRVARDASVSWRPFIRGELPPCRNEAQGKVERDRDKDKDLALYVRGAYTSQAAVSPNGEHVVWIEHCKLFDQKTLQTTLQTTLHRWTREKDPVPTRPFPSLPTGQLYVAVAVNDRGEVAAITQDTLRFYVGEDEEISSKLSETGECVEFSPNGIWILVADVLGNGHLYKDRKPVGANTNTKGDFPNRSSPTSCAVANDGTAVIGLANGQVLVQQSDKSVPEPISELVPFRLTQKVRAVSIDPSGRFVAALGERQSDNCLRPVMGGQSLRLWDLKSPKSPEVPRLSTCFPGSYIVALGMPKQDDDQRWVVPFYEKGSNSTVALNYPSNRKYRCEACLLLGEDPTEVAQGIKKKIIEKAYPHGPPKMEEPKRIKALYGIEFRPK